MRKQPKFGPGSLPLHPLGCAFDSRKALDPRWIEGRVRLAIPRGAAGMCF